MGLFSIPFRSRAATTGSTTGRPATSEPRIPLTQNNVRTYLDGTVREDKELDDLYFLKGGTFGASKEEKVKKLERERKEGVRKWLLSLEGGEGQEGKGKGKERDAEKGKGKERETEKGKGKEKAEADG